jgi:hypothetical protein
MQRKSLCRAPSSSCRRCLSRLARLGLGTALARHLQSLAVSTAVPNLRRHMISPSHKPGLHRYLGTFCSMWSDNVATTREASILLLQSHLVYFYVVYCNCLTNLYLSHSFSRWFCWWCARRSSPCRLASWTCEESCAHSIGSGSIHISVKLQ